METEAFQRTWPRQIFGQGGNYLPADCAPATTVGTAVIMSSMGALGPVLLRAKTRPARAVAQVLAFLAIGNLESWKAEPSLGRPGPNVPQESRPREHYKFLAPP